jgi:hypothetical protein
MAQSSQLLSVTVVEPLSADHTFIVDDVEGDTSMGTTVPEGQTVAVGASGLVCVTGGNDFYPTVRIEVFDGEPADSGEEWDAVDQVVLRCVSGTVRARDLNGRWWGESIVLGLPGLYRARVHSRGRTQALEMRKLFFRGVEEWLISFWPLGARPAAKEKGFSPVGRIFSNDAPRSRRQETPSEIRKRAALARRVGRPSSSKPPRSETPEVDWHDLEEFACAIREELDPHELTTLLSLLDVEGERDR